MGKYQIAPIDLKFLVDITYCIVIGFLMFLIKLKILKNIENGPLENMLFSFPWAAIWADLGYSLK